MSMCEKQAILIYQFSQSIDGCACRHVDLETAEKGLHTLNIEAAGILEGRKQSMQ